MTSLGLGVVGRLDLRLSLDLMEADDIQVCLQDPRPNMSGRRPHLSSIVSSPAQAPLVPERT